MPETLEIDVEQLMERIRDSQGKHRSEVPLSNSDTLTPESQKLVDFSFLQSEYDIQHVPLTSHRKVIGRFIVVAKNILRQLLTPVLERQAALNMANARVASYLREQVEGGRQQQTAALESLRASILEQQTALESFRASILEQQTAALESLRASILEQQTAALESLRAAILEQQTAALENLQTVILEQVQAWRRLTERRFGGLEQMMSRFHQRTRTEWEMVLTHLRTEEIRPIVVETERRLAEWEKALARLKTDYILQERRVTVLLEEARKRLPEPLSPDQLQTIHEEGKHVLEALYVSFEDQFRGTREDIKERFQIYLPLLEQAGLGTDSMPVLDVGCGRGEWLELLREKGLRAQGLDLNRVLVEDCKRQGLMAVEGEVIAYLSSLPANSLGAVTGFHIVEHLPFDVLVRLFDETVRVLKPGGVAIFETPNPANVLVGSHNFYLDPSHRNPLPSATLEFIAEARGLCQVEIMELHPYPLSSRVKDGDSEIIDRFNAYFYGPQDYAVVGRKV